MARSKRNECGDKSIYTTRQPMVVLISSSTRTGPVEIEPTCIKNPAPSSTPQVELNLINQYCRKYEQFQADAMCGLPSRMPLFHSLITMSLQATQTRKGNGTLHWTLR